MVDNIRKNIISNLAGQLYVSAIAILATPQYLKLMGVEAYALVSIFALIQSLFNMLDLGLSPTLARETARTRGGVDGFAGFFDVLRAINIVFMFIAIVGCVFLVASSGYISRSWLNVDRLDVSEVQFALVAMACSICMRWMSGFYRATVTGFEKFLWLSGWNSIVATLRFVAVIPVLVVFDGSFIAFFVFQVMVAAIEVFGLIQKSRRLIRNNFGEVRSSRKSVVESLKPVFGFSSGIAFTSVVWALITQSDKLVLSKLLSLSDYGFFSVGVLLASGVVMLGGPITSAAVPKMALLHASAMHLEMQVLYKRVSQYTAVAVVPATLVLYFYSGKIIELWTGNSLVSDQASEVFAFYTLGNCLMVLASLPLLLQYAEGKIRLHVIGNFIYALVYYPVLIWSVKRFGVEGACWSWLLINLISLVLWTPVIHSALFRNGHLRWLRDDLLKIALPCCIFVYASKELINFTGDRVLDISILLIIYLMSLVFGAVGSSNIRKTVFDRLSENN
ncbi:lipopolysaccharide biosynthesis protein [Propionivibrio dicarboxylicus]|uniref:Membrane protein involved in the export of O-antigen and teichoic acid n=1 Tax=Propionivibrio dicarboxylicus TaxID=83767 RepID=A0A1G8DVK2_9RHOO|nr:oligosaccharide flippase family protein [Propionivibrio dicarboxylicus]SDH61687.1 Membrane protein involved in the export of O-antigen and teichoic acid [Propionivibrio dicarboxylicus]